MAEHTSTPWQVADPETYAGEDAGAWLIETVLGDPPEGVCEVWDKNDAERIVRAVNSHEELVEAVRSALEFLCLDDPSLCTANLLAINLETTLAKAGAEIEA